MPDIHLAAAESVHMSRALTKQLNERPVLNSLVTTSALPFGRLHCESDRRTLQRQIYHQRRPTIPVYNKANDSPNHIDRAKLLATKFGVPMHVDSEVNMLHHDGNARIPTKFNSETIAELMSARARLSIAQRSAKGMGPMSAFRSHVGVMQKELHKLQTYGVKAITQPSLARLDNNLRPDPDQDNIDAATQLIHSKLQDAYKGGNLQDVRQLVDAVRKGNIGAITKQVYQAGVNKAFGSELDAVKLGGALLFGGRVGKDSSDFTDFIRDPTGDPSIKAITADVKHGRIDKAAVDAGKGLYRGISFGANTAKHVAEAWANRFQHPKQEATRIAHRVAKTAEQLEGVAAKDVKEFARKAASVGRKARRTAKKVERRVEKTAKKVGHAVSSAAKKVGHFFGF